MLPLLTIADHFIEGDLVIRCKQFITERMNPFFASNLYLSIQKPILQSFSYTILSTIFDNVYQLIMPENIIKLPIETVEYIYKQDNIIIGSEYLLFESFITYYIHVNADEQKEMKLNKIFYHIQWNNITYEDFLYIIQTFDIPDSLQPIINDIKMYYESESVLPEEFIIHERIYNCIKFIYVCIDFKPCDITIFDIIMNRSFIKSECSSFLLTDEEKDLVIQNYYQIPLKDYLNDENDWIRESVIQLIYNISDKLDISMVNIEIIIYCFTLWTMKIPETTEKTQTILQNIFNNSEIISNEILTNCSMFIIYFYQNCNKHLINKSLENADGIYFYIIYVYIEIAIAILSRLVGGDKILIDLFHSTENKECKTQIVNVLGLFYDKEEKLEELSLSKDYLLLSDLFYNIPNEIIKNSIVQHIQKMKLNEMEMEEIKLHNENSDLYDILTNNYNSNYSQYEEDLLSEDIEKQLNAIQQLIPHINQLHLSKYLLSHPSLPSYILLIYSNSENNKMFGLSNILPISKSSEKCNLIYKLKAIDIIFKLLIKDLNNESIIIMIIEILYNLSYCILYIF